MNIKILVATHKSYKMPEDSIYLPIQVGAEGKETLGFQRDNEGENISDANARWSELTALYWAWKNLDADYIGLVHYRRHFTAASLFLRMWIKDKYQLIANEEKICEMLEAVPLILPKKRKYYIETMQSHFLHLPYAHEKDFEILKNVIREMTPDYMDCFETVMNRSRAHMFNMFIMKKEYFKEYCKWMFPILLETDKRIDMTGYTRREERIIGDYGEFMLDIWNEKQRIPYRELPVIFMEKQNWLKKIGIFLLRKINIEI